MDLEDCGIDVGFVDKQKLKIDDFTIEKNNLLEAQYSDEKLQKVQNTYEPTIFSSFSSIRNRSTAAALDLPGAVSDFENAKSQAVNLLNAYDNKQKEMKATLEAYATNAKEISEQIRLYKIDINEARAKVRKSRDLNDLRKEQADALKNKDSAYYHSSYLGLWVPLKEQTNAILFAISIFFILSGLLLIGFMSFMKWFPDKVSFPKMGGFFQRKK